MRWTYVALAVTLSLGAALMVLSPYRALTPGILHAGHRTQQNNCFSCHTLLSGAPTTKCAVCHKAGEIGFRSVKGEVLPKPNTITQIIHRAIGGECYRCHSEHGARFGANTPRRFSHDLLNADTVAGCAACHSQQKPANALHAAVTAECSRCHGTKGWKPATYDHDKLFRFDRNHPPRCADCHQAGTSLKEYSCTNCHEHSLDKMLRKHREEGISNVAKCRRCHPSANERDTTIDGKPRQKKEHQGERD
jgi:LSD1 subclass zinc finger protein